MDNSASIRRQIGKVTRQVARCIAAVYDMFNDYEVNLDNPHLNDLTSDDLPIFTKDVHLVRSNLLRYYDRLEHLHQQWQAIIPTNPTEENTFTTYIEKYGDYRSNLHQAVAVLEKMDSAVDQLHQEFKKRGVPFPVPTPATSDASSHDSNLDNFKAADIIMTAPAHQQPMVNTYPVRHTADSASNQMFNFVDASLLSKIDLPTFSGSLLDFQEFWERFSTLIGNKPNIDDATKFSLLKSSLKGKALQCIQGLSITSANYHIAIDILKTHFDDKVTTRHVLYTKLANLPPCDHAGKQLQQLYNQMFALIRQFCTYEDDNKEYGLGAILLNKLPRHIRSKIYDKTFNQTNLTPSALVRILTDIVKKETTLLEMEPQDSNYEDRHVFHVVSDKHQGMPTFRTKPTRKSTTTTRCPLCQKYDHLSFNCHVYPSAKSRIEAVKKLHLCYNCLSKAHFTKNCTSKRTCSYCSKRHHSSLCSKQRYSPDDSTKFSKQRGRRSQRQQDPQHHATRQSKPNHPRQKEFHAHFNEQNVSNPDAAPVADSTVTLHNTTEPQRQRNPLLMCAAVRLFNPLDESKEVRAIALLDTGASQSYITMELAEKLQLPASNEHEIHMYTFGSKLPLSIPASDHSIGIRCDNGSNRVLRVQAIPVLTKELRYAYIHDTGEHKSLKIEQNTPNVLIGMDYFWDLVFSDNFSISPLSNGYRVINTRIGKVVADNTFRYDRVNYFALDESSTTADPSKHQELLELVERFWSNESMGILDKPNETDDEKCLQHFNNSISYSEEERRYWVKLPFKTSPAELPSNRDLAFSRFVSTVKMLQKNPTYLQKYHAIFETQLQKEIIEVAEDDSPQYAHYLAHHGVVSESHKHTKIRCVFDGSAKKKGFSSLNELLHKGPNLLPDLLGVLLRIRTMPILISGDIEKAFLMVGLHEDSRDFTRFFWLRDPSKGITRANTITYRFRRVPFGLICSPFLLAGTIHFHLSNANTPLSRKVLRNTYVDNIFYGVNSVEEGQQFYKDSKTLFSDAGMNLRDYASNDEELNHFIKDREGYDVDERTKILGTIWNTTTDQLELEFPHIDEDDSTTWTKRRILQKVASIYDPFGWLSPITLVGKIFIQKLWSENITWDQALPQQLQEEWTSITKSWKTTRLTLSRPFTSKRTVNVTYDIHVFTDASQYAYAASSYLIEKHDGDPKKSSFLVSKSRIAPRKPLMTIPKLELSALVIGANLLHYLKLHLDIEIDRTFLWSDSRVALAWTQSEKELPIFIRNRVRTIKDKASEAVIRHVPGSMNPADIASRGAAMDNLASNNLWWNGPEFLLKEENLWPEDEKELVSKLEQLCCVTAREQLPNCPIINSERFSKWTRILSCTIIIITFITRLSSKAAHHFGSTAVEIRTKATTALFRMAQMESPPESDLSNQLSLYKCKKNHLLRVSTRINNSALPQETKEPIFLPRKSNITSLYILYVHEKNHHCGTEQTLVALRQHVWIPKGRSTVKRIINNRCYVCRRLKAKPFKLPDFPLHPTHRVNPPTYPFENSGLDVMGPVKYRSIEGEIKKCWFLLITCLNCRAIVVDLIHSLSSTTFLHNLRRFIAGYGCPKRILCDNAPAFKSFAEAQSEEPIQEKEDRDLIDYCTTNRIQFKFIPAFSPWQGGVYERMVAIFKTSLTHATSHRVLPLETLETLVKESEAICNSRPLTYVNDQVDFIPLRPVDFIRPSALLSGPRLLNEDNEWKPRYTARDHLIKDWKSGLHLLNDFWNRWKDEYLTCLRERHQTTHPHPRSYHNESPTYGEYVLIHDNDHPRGTWKMGQVCGSTDDYLRSVQIRLPSQRVITRPINLISRFEIDSEPIDSTPDSTHPSTQARREDGNTISSHPMVTRSKRRRTLLQNLLSLFIIFTTFSSLATSASNRCPGEPTIARKVVYATPCVSNGAAIATYYDHDRRHMCWFPVECPMGEIQPVRSDDSRLCGPKCECPQWSQFCSHYSGKHIQQSRVSNVPPMLLHFVPDEVCSFKKSPACSQRKKIGMFNQIELYDGALLLVPTLRVTVKDYMTTSDFVCVNSEGKTLSSAPPYKGTSLFCQKHQCSSNVDKFCLYDSPIALFTWDNTSSTQTTIPIKAWGTTTREFYPYISEVQAEIISMRTNCSQGGVTITADRELSTIEACIRSYCISTFNATTANVLFPTELVVFKYTVTIRAWKNGQRLHDSSITCPSHPICEILRCNICLEKFYNIQCWTTPDTIFAVALVAIMISLYWILVPIVFIIKKIIKIYCTIQFLLFKNIVSYLWNSRRKASESSDPTSQPHRVYSKRRHLSSNRHRPYRVSPSTIALTILTLTLEGGICCSDVISIASSTEKCLVNSTTTTCVFNKGVTLTLQPLGQEVCLSLRNTKNESIGVISLRMQSIRYVCQKKIEFFTRDHEILTESVHRCYRAGSCQKGKCDTTKSSDIVGEFSWRAANHPGFTFCKTSCGCLLTCGCFFCTPSCLFYRYYATPTSDTIYTIFTCPVWELTVTAEMILQLQGKPETFPVILRPGRTTRIRDITLSLLSTISPQLPVLGSTFITDGTTSAMTMNVQANALTPGTPAQLQCLSKMDATQFRCRFSSSACTCSAGSYKATCTCPNGHISSYLNQKTLPLFTKNVMIEQYDDTIAAHARIGSAISLQLEMENVNVISLQSEAQCSITSSTVEGCYSCLLGARVTFVCYSSEDQTTADIICDKQQQIAVCSRNGKLSEIIFHFDSPSVNINCTISCPGGASSFQINGVLDYVNDANLQDEISHSSEENFNHSDNTITTVVDWISSLLNRTITFLCNLSFFAYIKISLICIILVISLNCIASLTSFSRRKKRT